MSKTGRVNSFSPELSSKVRLAKHRSCSFNQRAVASFSDSILVRSSDGRKVLRDSFFLKELIKGIVFEFSAMIASYLSNSEVVKNFHLLNKGNDFIRCIAFGSDKEDPSVPGILINNDECIFLSSNGLDINRSEEIHVEKLKKRAYRGNLL